MTVTDVTIVVLTVAIAVAVVQSLWPGMRS